MDLFLRPQVMFKTATMSTRMPEDPNAWPQEILQQLFKEVPYMSDFSPHVNMDKVDAEKGYAFGHITVMNRTETQLDSSSEANAAAGIRQVRVPIVIKDGELFPLDLLITDDSRVLPLTESRLRAAIFRPQAFDVTARTPGDQSMIGQLYPPYRQNYGFGGGGMTTDAGTAKESSARLLSAIAGTLNASDINYFIDALNDPQLRMAYEKNAAAVTPSLAIILQSPTEQSKLASALDLVRPTVVQVTKLASGYRVKRASHHCWAPKEAVLDRRTALSELGPKVVLAADLNGAATMAEDATTQEPEGMDSDTQGMGPVDEFGMYKVRSTEGQELVGYVLTDLLDTDGTALPISLFTNGSHAAVQEDILGIPVEGSGSQLPSGDSPVGYGSFYLVDADGVVATIPLKIAGSYSPSPQDPTVYQAETYDGRPIEVSVQPNIQTVVGMTQEGRMLVPAHWKWLPLGQSEAVDLVGTTDEMPKEAEARRYFETVEVLASGESFSFRGPAVEKLASEAREFLDLDAAMFLLGGLGVEPTYGIRKLSHAMTGHAPIPVKVGRSIGTMEEMLEQSQKVAEAALAKMPSLRRDLSKEAAFVTDPEAVDTMLSLGFVNPENVTTFIGYMPVIEKTQESLCNLLFAARVGLSDIPTPALETAVRSTEEVLEGLKTMAFQGPAQYG